MAHPSELEFFSFLSWTPRAETSEQRRLANWVRVSFKQDRRHSQYGLPSEYLARRLVALVEPELLEGEFGRDALLVPVPRSNLLKRGDLWPAERIAHALVEQQLGGRVVRALRRREALPRSSGRRSSAERNSVDDQVRTLAVDATLDASGPVVLVDDVITSGATLLGAARAIGAAAGAVELRGFAAFRTISAAANFENAVDPFLGRVLQRSDGRTAARPRG